MMCLFHPIRWRAWVFFIGISHAFANPPHHQRLLAQVVHYVNHMSTLKADFIQTNDDGSSAEGKLLMQAPSHAKMTYDKFILLVTDENTLIHYDVATERRTFLSLRDVPLGILMRRPFVLDQSVDILDIKHEHSTLKLILARARAHNQGTLTLTFSEHPFQLRAWEILDAQHIRTSISLFNVEEHVFLEPSLFRLPKSSRR